MERFQSTLLSVWREACRHIDTAASTANLAPILRARLPIAGVAVRLLDAEEGVIRTVGCDGVAGDDPPTTPRATELPRLARWCRGREPYVRAARARRDRLVDLWVPAGFEGEVFIGPLCSEHDTLGALVLQARDHLQPAHLEVARALLEPFAAALENSARLRQLESLRQAAEADRQALLRRLGRSDLDDEVVGAERGLGPVMERVRLVAPSAAPVLLLGETGSGKEVIARAIHLASPRHDGAFLRVNCGAVPPELIDSELFGHEQGSFTGATAQRRGWFERADGGTLFLDEVGELPAAAQVRLLRVLQDGMVDRVGGDRPLQVDVRIVAATHRDLPAMVQQRQFREDLWYRVAVFPIVIPPLRERLDDIPDLADHFARRAATRFGLPLCLPTDADVDMLRRYHWPGNVREFAAVIDRAAILGNGRGLELGAALGPIGAATPSRTSAALSPPPPRPASFPSLPATTPGDLGTAMRDHISAVLSETYGRIDGPFGAATRLNLHPQTLRARMRKLGIDWTSFRSFRGR